MESQDIILVKRVLDLRQDPEKIRRAWRLIERYESFQDIEKKIILSY